MKISRLKVTDDLAEVCEQMQPDKWAADNEMTAYEPELLKEFLERGNYLVLAYEGNEIAGAVTAYPLPHPSKGGNSLYVHELDTHPNYRRRGIATKLMEEMFKIAKEQGLTEVWVGADAGNVGANNLYKKLNPDEIDPSVIYAYTVKSQFAH